MRRIGVEPFVITGRNNVITRSYWTRWQERVKLVDYRWPRTDLTSGGAAVELPVPRAWLPQWLRSSRDQW